MKFHFHPDAEVEFDRAVEYYEQFQPRPGDAGGAPHPTLASHKKGNGMRKLEPPLSELSLAEKLDLMENLWADLTKDEKALKSPAWHETVLKDREEAFAAGKVTASDWEEAKKRIQKKVS